MKYALQTGRQAGRQDVVDLQHFGQARKRENEGEREGIEESGEGMFHTHILFL
jgi:hypothetical protein